MDLEHAKFIIASGPVIVENGKVLLDRHGDDNFWKFPGGRIENFDFPDETQSLEKACRRETKEEIGIDIEIIAPIKPMMIKHPDRPDTVVILIHYLAKKINKIKPGPDIKEWQWQDIDNLPANCAPNIKPVLDQCKK